MSARWSRGESRYRAPSTLDTRATQLPDPTRRSTLESLSPQPRAITLVASWITLVCLPVPPGSSRHVVFEEFTTQPNSAQLITITFEGLALPLECSKSRIFCVSINPVFVRLTGSCTGKMWNFLCVWTRRLWTYLAMHRGPLDCDAWTL